MKPEIDKTEISENDENKDENTELIKDKIKNSSIEDDEDFIPNKKKFEAFNNDPYLDSNIFSRFFMYWGYKVLKISKSTKIKKEHLGKLNKKNDSRYFYANLNSIWEQKGYRNKTKHALLLCILRSNLSQLLLVFLLSVSTAAADYFAVIFIKIFIDYFDPNSDKSSFIYNLSLWKLGLCFISLQTMRTFLGIHTLMRMNVIGNRAAFELNCFIYNKILKASPSSFTQRATEGEIVNFIQVDSMRFSWMIMLSPNIFINPIQIIAYSYLLFDFFSFSFFAGLGILVLFFLINLKVTKLFHFYQKKMLAKKDIRMRKSTEIFDNIKILKLYNWEKQFMKKLLLARKDEMDAMLTRFNVTTTNISLFWLCPSLVACATLGLYQYLNDKLSISTMLIGLSLFNKLQDPIRQLPSIINNIIESAVSLKRIEEYIRQPETLEENLHKEKYDNNSEYAIRIKKGNFSWGVKQEEKKKKKEKEKEEKIEEEEVKKPDKNIFEKINDLDENLIPNSERESKLEELQEDNEGNIIKEGCKIEIDFPRNIKFDVTLKEIDFEVKKGELLGIIGEVGSGKSSLLQAILNCLILLNPKECDGIHINGEIGYASQIPWIQNDTIKNNILFFNKYNKEKYEEILDKCQLKYDLDNFEGKDLTEIGEKGVNLSGGQKVRVSLARAVYANPDIYLFDDPISALDANIGKKIMKELIIDYLKGKTRVVVTHALQYLKYMDRIIYMKNGRIQWVGTFEEIQNQDFFISMKKLSKLNSENNNEENIKEKTSGIKDFTDSGREIIKIIKEEDEEIGSVKFGVYINYSRYLGGKSFLLIVIFIMILWQANKGGSDLWLAFWSLPENQKESQENKNSKWTFFGAYCSLYLSSVVFIFLRIFMLTRGIIRLGRYLHKDMIIKLVRAPINLFHEIVPRGQIFNRLSKDLDALGMSVFTVGDTLVCFLASVGSFVLCAIYDPYSILYMPFILIIGFFVTKFYLVGSRPLTRLEAISRSPILNTINETIPGYGSIKAFGKENNYLDKFYSKINDCFNINICMRGIKMWLTEMFKLLCVFYLLYLVINTLINEDEVTSQSVGITFTYSVILQENLSWSFSIAADLENIMISLERCLQYTKIESEAPNIIKSKDDQLIEKKWPNKGKIKFENYSVKYRPNTEIVLKKLNFEIKGNEKVGVVGRTGSGKSTICLCLFRILEPLEGTIYIDDEDITKIGLDILRKNLTIIPQDPCLMEGSLRYNIDPFDIKGDEEIISILKKIGFEYTESDCQILNRKIEQHGSNLSVGEKQLICIARAILRKTKIIVMDEATANIDMKTEEKIQKALQYVLNDSTVITVAHRIKTIIDYDKILVLDNGSIIEFDSPQNLLKNEKSLFFELYSKSTI